jgi:hypothetical protein
VATFSITAGLIVFGLLPTLARRRPAGRALVRG